MAKKTKIDFGRIAQEILRDVKRSKIEDAQMEQENKRFGRETEKILKDVNSRFRNKQQ